MNLYYLVYLSNRSLKGQDLVGVLPAFLAKLSYLKTIRKYLSEWASMYIFSANNLIGELPPSLANLTKLIELEIQASGLQGPIPSSISVLKDLTEL
ncbi:hypothetical protein AAG906_028289 [Vitis piasezkii]